MKTAMLIPIIQRMGIMRSIQYDNYRRGLLEKVLVALLLLYQLFMKNPRL